MEYVTEMVAGLESYLGSNKIPHGFFERDSISDPSQVLGPAYSGTYWVPQGHLSDPNCLWTYVNTDQHVMVPIQGYRLAKADYGLLLACAIQWGSEGVLQLQKHTQQPVKKIFTFLGSQIVDMRFQPKPRDAIRCFLGMAFQVEE